MGRRSPWRCHGMPETGRPVRFASQRAQGKGRLRLGDHSWEARMVTIHGTPVKMTAVVSLAGDRSWERAVTSIPYQVTCCDGGGQARGRAGDDRCSAGPPCGSWRGSAARAALPLADGLTAAGRHQSADNFRSAQTVVGAGTGAVAGALKDLRASLPSLILALSNSLTLAGSKSLSVPPSSKCEMNTSPMP